MSDFCKINPRVFAIKTTTMRLLRQWRRSLHDTTGSLGRREASGPMPPTSVGKTGDAFGLCCSRMGSEYFVSLLLRKFNERG